MLKQSLPAAVSKIYIPLWFYSNAFYDKGQIKITEFTFHYGSILMIMM